MAGDRGASRRDILRCGPVLRQVPRHGHLLTRAACNLRPVLRVSQRPPESLPLLAGLLPRTGQLMRPAVPPVMLHHTPRGPRPVGEPPAHRIAARFSI